MMMATTASMPVPRLERVSTAILYCSFSRSVSPSSSSIGSAPPASCISWAVGTTWGRGLDDVWACFAAVAAAALGFALGLGLGLGEAFAFALPVVEPLLLDDFLGVLLFDRMGFSCFGAGEAAAAPPFAWALPFPFAFVEAAADLELQRQQGVDGSGDEGMVSFRRGGAAVAWRAGTAQSELAEAEAQVAVRSLCELCTYGVLPVAGVGSLQASLRVVFFFCKSVSCKFVWLATRL